MLSETECLSADALTAELHQRAFALLMTGFEPATFSLTVITVLPSGPETLKMGVVVADPLH